MFKKILLIGMAVAAFAALVAPAMASASELLNSGGKPLAVGSTITATSTNTVTKLSSGATLTCSNVTLGGKVEKNGPTIEVVDNGVGTSTATGCKVNGSTPVEIDPTLNNLIIGATTPGTASFSFNVTTLGCEATSGTSSVTKGAGGAGTLAVTATVGGTCGPGTLTGEYTLGAGVTVKD
jgi:hypothetical protein